MKTRLPNNGRIQQRRVGGDIPFRDITGDKSKGADKSKGKQADGVFATDQMGVSGALSQASSFSADQFDVLLAKGDAMGAIDVLERNILPLTQRKDFDPQLAASWIGDLHTLQHRAIGLANSLSLREQPEAAKAALNLLGTIGQAQSNLFEFAVALADKASPKHAVQAWVVHKDTMKKPGFHSDEVRQNYFVGKAKEFVQKGGNLNDIKPVTKEGLNAFKSGEFVEWAVDAFDVARMSNAEDPAPGHSLLAWGGDALSAGTMRVFKDDSGDISQVVIGTFSGHFRAGQDTLHHMARHVMAAGVPADKIVLQGGEAGSARAMEVLQRAMGVDGAEIQRDQMNLDAEAMRTNPYLKPAEAGEKKPEPTKAEKDAYEALFLMRQEAALAFEDGAILDRPSRIGGGEARRLASAIENALTKAELAGSLPAVYGQARELLADILLLGTKQLEPNARKTFEQVYTKWEQHDYGQGAIDPLTVFSKKPIQDRNARVVATLDVKITPAQVQDMLKAGMDVARFNPAHGTPAELKACIKMIRQEAVKLGRPISIQMDLPGPKIRLGTFKNPENKKFNDIFLTKGDTVKVTNKDIEGDPKTFPIDFDGLKDVKPGERIFMNDGTVELLVKDLVKHNDGSVSLDAEVKKGGKVWDNKGVNLPDTELTSPAFTPEDQALLKEMAPDLDVVAISFVRNPQDVQDVQKFLVGEGRPLPLIAKIERKEALTNLEAIAQVSDALMVARGDLGVEIGFENVPLAERAINAAGNTFGKPTMVATEVFMGTVESSRPTRGDVEGVFNAIAEHGADAIMLGKETSFTKNPGDVVRMANRVIEKAESEKQDQPYLTLRDRGKAPELAGDDKAVVDSLLGKLQDRAAEKREARSQVKASLNELFNAGKPQVSTGVNKTITNAAQPAHVSGEQKDIRTHLGIEGLYSKVATGFDLAGAVEQFETSIARIDPKKLQQQVGGNLGAWMSELHLMQHTAISLCNKLSLADQPDLAMRAMKLLQPVADLQTIAFEKAVKVDAEADPKAFVGAWKTHKDTMKKQGAHTALDRLQYYAAKAEKFLRKGGSMDQVKDLSIDNLKEMPSGGLLEFVVDAYDQARFYDADKKPAPGHTVAAKGEDALTAGTMRVYKNKDGEIENVIVGTFSGHFRADHTSLHHMVRNLVALGIPEEKISMQGGEAGGARALEVLNMALGKDGAESQRQQVELNGKASRYNPFAVDTQGTKAKTPDFDEKGTLPAIDAQGLQDAFHEVRELSGDMLGGFAPGVQINDVEGATELAAKAEDVLNNSQRAGNPVMYSQVLSIVRHVAELGASEISPEAQKPFLQVAQAFDRKVFGSGITVDPADAIGPKPTGDRRARVVATMDPKASPAKIREMLKAGMNVARYNPAHASLDELKANMASVREEAAKLGKDVAIQIDLAGPKIRLGLFKNPDNKEFNDIFLTAGDTVKVTNANIKGDPKTFPIDFEGLKDVQPGERIFMNDGTVELLVKSVGKDKNGKAILDAEVKKGGKVWDKKGVNLPDTKLSEPVPTDEDLALMQAILPDVDTIALSFVRGPEDVLLARQKMMEFGKVVPIIAKIERPEAVASLDKIAVVSDAMMVARGDLGVEIGFENVPSVERDIARIGNTLGKPVMVATEVFSSMAKGSSRPTRGDVEGLYSAISGQGFDAVMLGKETSFPDHPGEVIEAASRVIELAEEQGIHRNTAGDTSKPSGGSLLDVRLAR